MDYDKRHRELMLPCVRVRAGSAGGSGTVIYSKPDDEGQFSTYILTNHHVVDGLIEVKDEWNALLKRNAKVDILSPAEVHFFEYEYQSRAVGATAIGADVAAYDANEDLALLKLRAGREVPSVAKLYPRGEENKLRVTMPVMAVGAGLGEPPLATAGQLNGFNVTIDNREFWSNSASIIFGNSGGALFLEETNEFIGVPSRVRISAFGYSADAITHIAFSIPITRVYNFLESQMFEFIYDDGHTEEGDKKRRDALRRNDEERIAGRESKGLDGDSGVPPPPIEPESPVE